MGTVVLVHGGWHGARCWRRVTPPGRTQRGARGRSPAGTGRSSRRRWLSRRRSWTPSR